ncbi:bacillithiol system redox-active protein YtxJ [Flavobacterium sp. DG1-102-2]|uniref:bacillithiol system redox-active protein YtxJ n=1 Tax=Flavobacterium sp. DG1-102-2 TaxID=3081663 RepID=UPI00294A806F|nr:bacillithiol system redox-active protein YtxJ [Flavobacterium sp. DG1-102-2]MDV6169942.1 bacillithiol system redox-active protein YtxJ [Flavobacterium sp. DG1-102-2]
MSILGKLFGDSDSKDNSSSNMDWNDLTELKQLDEITEESREVPVVIFKHSTRCSISRMALKNFEREYNIEKGSAKPYFLDLLEHRDISNAIASRFGVMHQSPQLILIKQGTAVYDTSHSDIDAETLKNKLAS